MTEKKFKINALRIISLFIIPALIILIFLFILFIGPRKESPGKLINILIVSLLGLFILGVFIFLFVNHLNFAKTTELTFINKELYIYQNDIKEKVNFSDIEKITEYSTSKLPWSTIMFWRLKTNKKEYLISSLTISKFNFDGYFHNKIEQIPTFFPTIF